MTKERLVSFTEGLIKMITAPRFWLMMLAVVLYSTNTTDDFLSAIEKVGTIGGSLAVLVQTFDRTVDKFSK